VVSSSSKGRWHQPLGVVASPLRGVGIPPEGSSIKGKKEYYRIQREYIYIT